MRICIRCRSAHATNASGPSLPKHQIHSSIIPCTVFAQSSSPRLEKLKANFRGIWGWQSLKVTHLYIDLCFIFAPLRVEPSHLFDGNGVASHSQQKTLTSFLYQKRNIVALLRRRTVKRKCCQVFFGAGSHPHVKFTNLLPVVFFSFFLLQQFLFELQSFCHDQ